MVSFATLRQFHMFMILFSFVNMVLMVIVFVKVILETKVKMDIGILIMASALFFFVFYIYSTSANINKDIVNSKNNKQLVRTIYLLVPTGFLLYYGIRGSVRIYGGIGECGDSSDCHLVGSNVIFAALTGFLALVEMVLVGSVTSNQV